MIGVIDSTLREGEQMAGVYLTATQKLALVDHLAAIGVEEIELGIPAMSSELAGLLPLARRRAPETRFALWSRAIPAEIAHAAALRPDVLAISIPVSDLHITARLQRDRAWVLASVTEAVTAARAAGVAVVSLGLEDAGRAEQDFLSEVIHTAVAAGVARVRLADTIGQLTPLSMAALVLAAKRSARVEVGVHTHNDFGMATANAVAALEAGADWVDGSLLGIGERAGMARLEELVGYLALRGGQAQYDTTRLAAACRDLARMVGMRIAPHHPIVGKRIFACETGLHLDGLAKDRRTYEPYPPERVRAGRRYTLGKKVGLNAVAGKLCGLGIHLAGDELTRLVAKIRLVAHRIGRPLKDAEVLRLIAGAAGAKGATERHDDTEDLRSSNCWL
jgi:homocitrate synthase NifV